MGKALVLVDGKYYEVIKKVFNIDLNIVKFSNFLCGENCERLRTYYYDALPWTASKDPAPEDVNRKARKQRYFDFLNLQERVQVRLGRCDKKVIYCPNCLKNNKKKVLLRCPECGEIYVKFDQKLVDVLLSIDVTKFSATRQIDKIIVIAGDSDFVPAVESAKENGVVVKLVYAQDESKGIGTHDELLRKCDERLQLTDEFFSLHKEEIT